MNEQILKIPLDEDIAIASRRNFLKKLAYGSVLALSGCGIETSAIRDRDGLGMNRHSYDLTGPRHKTLSFEHAHTGEKLRLTYFENGRYVNGALHEINYLLRDFHNDEVHSIDTALLDQLYDMKQNLGLYKPFHILSAYRSPATNARLRKHSRGVAEHSYHIKGRAIDIRVEGVSTKAIRNTALAMARGGVGYYPRSNFVHLDTGKFRTW